MFFSTEHNKKLRAADPSLKTTDVAKKVGEDWNALAEKDKKRFYLLADQDKVRHQEQMDQLMSQGFFINADGVKSTEMIAKKKRGQSGSTRKAQTEPVEELEKKVLDKKSPKRVKKSD